MLQLLGKVRSLLGQAQQERLGLATRTHEFSEVGAVVVVGISRLANAVELVFWMFSGTISTLEPADVIRLFAWRISEI